MSQPDWKKALPSPPDGGQLLEAWFTTYDQPDAGLLVEHLFPCLLRLDNTLTSDAKERTLYFGELGTALERLRGRLTIISSPPRNRKFKNDGEEQTQNDSLGRESATYPWLWRYVNHFTVGTNGPAVQHAKLWAFHWQCKEGEFLELHVSSTNLTTSAFKDQIQAGWSLRVELDESKPTKKRQQGWGDLISFLNELGDSAGQYAKNRTGRLIQLLCRTDCPNGITFVASMPKSRKRGAHWLKILKPQAIHILVPTIGDWDHKSVLAWANDSGVLPDKIHLKWIDQSHPWTCGWALTKQTEEVLRKTVQLNHLKVEHRIHDEHVDSDERWSHAKLYLLHISKKKTCLLVTSANWSVSAWGAGKENPRNFELGVLFDTNWKWPEEEVTESLAVPFSTTREHSGKSKLQWAEASWNGALIELCARSTDNIAPISVVMTFGGGTKTNSVTLTKGVASMQWSDMERTPLTAHFTQEDDSLEVNILDLRPPFEFAKTPLPEVDPGQEKALREAFLLQRYGGAAVEDSPNPKKKKKGTTDRGGATPAADYSVQTWNDARAAFHVVDQWKIALQTASVAHTEHEQILLDGRQLQEIYDSRGDVASRLAAEELGWRVDDIEKGVW